MAEPGLQKRASRRILPAAALLGLLYYAAARLGLSLAVINPSITAVWPPSALGFVALLVLGRRAWPGVFAGAFLVNLEMNHAHGLGWAAAALVAAGMAAGNTLESLFASWAVSRWGDGPRSLESAGGVLKMSLLAGLLSPVIAATTGALCLSASGLLPRAELGAGWLTWWLGDCNGVLIISPLLLSWLAPAPPSYNRIRVYELAGFIGFSAAVVWLGFFRFSLSTSFMVLPILIWSAFRFGIRTSAMTVAAISIATIACTVGGHGPFSAPSNIVSGLDLMLLQCFMGTMAVSATVMAALVAERERSDEALRLANARLEEEVERRTRELVESKKMEAVGRLAGGIAHEFNNILTGIVGLAVLIREEAAGNAQAAEDAGTIVTACRRGAALVGRLLAFARRREAERKPLDLNAVVSECSKMLRAAVGDKINLDLALDPGLPSVLAARDNLEQILLNLCLNSRDAMAGAGSIAIGTAQERVAETRLLSHGAVTAGSYVVLSFADTGSGIPAEIRPMIFEPFFSTKKTGEGTGLGLAIVYRIVADHKGAIDLTSRPGRTEFRIYLPATTDSPAPAAAPAPSVKPPRGSETLLIADDDELVRMVLVRALEPLGYTLLVAKDGEEALRIYDENAERVSMAMLDIVMPKLGGDRVYVKIAEKRPKFKAAFMSGHATPQAEELIAKLDLPFIPKPFAIDRIPFVVRDLLDRG
jgi:signal transduction histidine kinase